MNTDASQDSGSIPDPEDAFEDELHQPADHQAGEHAGESMDAAAIEQISEAFREHIAALEAERDDFKERWMRSEAEMINLRNRTKREVEETRQYAVQKFARDVAEAAENLRRGLDSLPQQAEGESDIVSKLRSGFEGVERSFIAMLERNGVSRVDPTFQPFDANKHQAMAEQPTGEHPPGTVIQAWTPVWTLNGRLLRPAMVVVAKAADAKD